MVDFARRRKERDPFDEDAVGAVLSPDGVHRYLLWRAIVGVTTGKRLLFVMLNPSTADSSVDDPTVLKCMAIAKALGFSGIEIVNLFAFRSSHPKDLKTAPDPIGRLNEMYMAQAARRADMIICAWGNNADIMPGRAKEALDLMVGKLGCTVHHLGLTAKGHPKHPLARGAHRIPDDVVPELWMEPSVKTVPLTKDNKVVGTAELRGSPMAGTVTGTVKDPEVAEAILGGSRPALSMGYSVGPLEPQEGGLLKVPEPEPGSPQFHSFSFVRADKVLDPACVVQPTGEEEEKPRADLAPDPPSWDPSKDQKAAMDGIMAWWERNPQDTATLGGYAGTGKALAFDQEVQTPRGPRQIGDLEIGDLVFGSDGKPTRVLGVFPQGERQAHRVTFRDGASVECDLEHLWAVQTHKMRQKGLPPKTMTLGEIVASDLRFESGPHKFCIPLCAPVEYAEKDLPVHPYLLGLLIGDGTSLGKVPTLCVPDLERELIGTAMELAPEGMEVRANRAPACPQYRLVDPTQRGNRLTSSLRELGLGGLKSPQRFVPANYLQGSVQQRWDVLRGLMDADGSCRGNRTSFSTKSEQLARDVAALARSLGGTAIVSPQTRDEWQVNVKTFECPFRLRRKADAWSPTWKNPPSRFITSVVPTRLCEHVCIKVEAEDGLFLTNDYIVTHNTTIMGKLAYDLLSADVRVVFATPTGKAAQVLTRSLMASGVLSASVSTVHRLIYIPDADPATGRIRGWKRRKHLDADLIVLDEASMVTRSMLNDLEYFGVPILAVGDHGQLPPVGEKAFLMAKPDFRLDKIHRQARGNPIIRLATISRNGAPFDAMRNLMDDLGDDRVQYTSMAAIGRSFGAPPGMAITYTNRLRSDINGHIREEIHDLDEETPPQPGEIVICLKNHKLDEMGLSIIANGMRGVVKSCKDDEKSRWCYRMDIEFDDPVGLVEDLKVNKMQFGRDKTFKGFDEVPGDHRSWWTVGALFDYGYALTCHKAQGSQADNVSVFMENWALERMDEDDRRRWIYTAITRAAERVMLVF